MPLQLYIIAAWGGHMQSSHRSDLVLSSSWKRNGQSYSTRNFEVFAFRQSVYYVATRPSGQAVWRGTQR